MRIHPYMPMAALVVIALLAGCGPGPDEPDPNAVPAPAAPAARTPPEPSSVEGGPFTPVGSLPGTRELEVTVEGQTELREASLFESPQGYAIYVLPQLAMTPEEPCCDIAHARADDGFFMRIERIDPHAEIDSLRGDIALALSNVGEPEDVSPQWIASPDFRDAELFMQARGDGVTLIMLVARIDGGRYRITLHLPHREAAEGINPSLWAMLGSLRTTGPRPEI